MSNRHRIVSIPLLGLALLATLTLAACQPESPSHPGTEAETGAHGSESRANPTPSRDVAGTQPTAEPGLDPIRVQDDREAQALPRVRQAVHRIHDQVQEDLNNLTGAGTPDTSRDDRTAVSTELRNDAQDVSGALRDEANQTLGEVKGGVRDTVDQVKGGVREALGEVKGGVRDTVDQVKGGVRQTVDSVKGDVRQQAQSVQDEVKQSARKMKDRALDHLFGPVQK